MIEFWKIFATAVLTAAASSLFGFLKDKKVASSKYTEESLRKIYVPIYKILMENLNPMDGYEGIASRQFYRIKEIVNEHPELCDPKLDSIIWGIDEDIRFQSMNYNHNDNNLEYELFDENRKLIDYVLHAFNKTRKSLGLPADRLYVYPILRKIRYSKAVELVSYHKRRLRRKMKDRKKNQKQ
ncbi:hypothetical protein C0971_10105 [Bacillus methanolicus]|uniref:hypothetical protein n=1 Tax=Bacillus methanolicus TaxID=1471 RepID=UPI00200D3CD0|nr:hypothetical protein [Bacillus methanolicus]UQD52325.1 hypothetical protein C0971_10105 [Bacillus methanolicus]